MKFFDKEIERNEVGVSDLRQWDSDCEMTYTGYGIVAASDYDFGTHGSILLQYRVDAWHGYKGNDRKYPFPVVVGNCYPEAL